VRLQPFEDIRMAQQAGASLETRPAVGQPGGSKDCGARNGNVAEMHLEQPRNLVSHFSPGMTGSPKKKDLSQALRALRSSYQALHQVGHKTEIYAQFLATDMREYAELDGTKELQKIRVVRPINGTGTQDHNGKLRVTGQYSLLSA
jgi:hypothetical protein